MLLLTQSSSLNASFESPPPPSFKVVPSSSHPPSKDGANGGGASINTTSTTSTTNRTNTRNGRNDEKSKENQKPLETNVISNNNNNTRLNSKPSSSSSSNKSNITTRSTKNVTTTKNTNNNSNINSNTNNNNTNNNTSNTTPTSSTCSSSSSNRSSSSAHSHHSSSSSASSLGSNTSTIITTTTNTTTNTTNHLLSPEETLLLQEVCSESYCPLLMSSKHQDREEFMTRLIQWIEQSSNLPHGFMLFPSVHLPIEKSKVLKAIAIILKMTLADKTIKIVKLAFSACTCLFESAPVTSAKNLTHLKEGLSLILPLLMEKVIDSNDRNRKSAVTTLTRMSMVQVISKLVIHEALQSLRKTLSPKAIQGRLSLIESLILKHGLNVPMNHAMNSSTMATTPNTIHTNHTNHGPTSTTTTTTTNSTTTQTHTNSTTHPIEVNGPLLQILNECLSHKTAQVKDSCIDLLVMIHKLIGREYFEHVILDSLTCKTSATIQKIEQKVRAKKQEELELEKKKEEAKKRQQFEESHIEFKPGEINRELFLKKSLRKHSSGESIRSYLKSLTHLHFDSCNISQIVNLEFCPNLRVLYLYDNKISKIEGLSQNKNLIHLHLHHNLIEKIEGLDALVNLQKLYLNHNRISRLEGLNQLTKLEELYLQHQDTQGMTIDETVIPCLKVSEGLNLNDDDDEILNVMMNGINCIHFNQYNYECLDPFQS